ncbi:MAG: ribosome maturation factor RimP [Clostridiales bacterium]|nr:ribosome maturation factor RimP [Clostridiales bacterium]
MIRKKMDRYIEDIVKPITDKLGIVLIDVEYKKEGNNYVLRLVIDSKNGVTIDDCENVSKLVSDKLDEDDPIENSYSLEVQSPGERVLKSDREFDYFKGRNVEVKLYEQMQGKKIFDGKLIGLENDLIKIEDHDKIYEFQKNKVSSVRLKIIF